MGYFSMPEKEEVKMKLYKQQDRSGFEQVPNELIRTASFKAIGLWAFMAQLPDDWDFSISGLAKVRSEGKDAIRAGVQELEDRGWLKRHQTRDKDGQFAGYDYEIIWRRENPTAVDPSSENPTTENPTQYHTERIKDRNNIIPNQGVPSPAKQATQTLPEEALKLADLLKEKILKNQPTAKIARNYRESWGRDIDKAHRIDGRGWKQLEGVITYAQDYSDFWAINIRSGGKLRKHYDRLESDAKRDFMQRGTMVIKSQNKADESELSAPF